MGQNNLNTVMSLTVFTVKPHRRILLKVSYQLSTTVLCQKWRLFYSTVCKQCIRGQTLLQNYHFNITAIIALQRTIAAFCICSSIYEFESGYISLTPSLSFIKSQAAGIPFDWKTNKGLCLSLLPLNITKSLFAYTIGSIVLFHVPFTWWPSYLRSLSNILLTGTRNGWLSFLFVGLTTIDTKLVPDSCDNQHPVNQVSNAECL